MRMRRVTSSSPCLLLVMRASCFVAGYGDVLSPYLTLSTLKTTSSNNQALTTNVLLSMFVNFNSHSEQYADRHVTASLRRTIENINASHSQILEPGASFKMFVSPHSSIKGTTN
eukprot:1145451-Pelagomonas_calceolata.AAC.3